MGDTLAPGRALVAGGAGFIGAHLCRRLLGLGCEVIAVDNLSTGREQFVAELDNSGFEFIRADVSEPLTISGSLDGSLDYVLNLASPASPPDYMRHPIATLDVGARGTRNLLDIAKSSGARFLMASTSEIYGDPTVHPQPEAYWGHVNPIGPRSVYDEAKRVAEAYTMAYHRTHALDTRIARIFNTYGPGMRPDDGRAIPNFITQALSGRPLTVFGDGSQTRSLCYVDDLVEGLIRLLASEVPEPVNLGNPDEMTILQLAEAVREATGSESEIHFVDLPEDDPRQRCPDISRAEAELGWQPRTPLSQGLPPTIEWFRSAAAA